ncbi:MAG: glutamate racemase [Candidatus Daviesbacteria bacterium]|nr:glutamate racemase [Candidatus Daviesbacteria bacterium]
MVRSIGVLDSGIGGLTVVKEIVKSLPNENIIYLGDTARVPYGTRGKDVITQFALEMVDFLLSKDVKFLVVACNTISAVCLDKIIAVSPVPVLGVIDPTVDHALKTSKSKRIGVIGTRATIGSGIYETEIKQKDNKAQVVVASCPLFVPIAEEGLGDHPGTRLIAKDYLSIFKDQDVDTLILGCTHYPLLSNTIKEVLGENITLVDSAKPAAETLEVMLQEKGLLNNGSLSGKLEIHVTDAPQRVQIIAEQFLGDPLPGGLKEVVLANL